MSARGRRGPTAARVRSWGDWYGPRILPNGEHVYGNGLYTVHVTVHDPARGLAGPLTLAIHDRRRTTRHDWREFQRIKAELCGREREAVELYPAASRTVDTVNEYHLWVLPNGERWPFGFAERRVENKGAAVPEEELRAQAEGMGVSVPKLKRMLVRTRQRPVDEEEEL